MNSHLDPLLVEENDTPLQTAKIFVLDTNVLLHDPMAVHAFSEHKIVIPMTVLEELDQIKDRRDKDVSREARIAIGNIDRILAEADTREIQEGVEIYSPVSADNSVTGTLAVYPDQLLSHQNESKFLRTNIEHDNDNRIINVALKLQEQDKDVQVCLVTKDINMRLKAKGSGLLHVEDYRNDKVLDDIDLLATGVQKVEGSFWDRVETVTSVQELRSTMHEVSRHVLEQDSYLNQFVVDAQGFVGRIASLGIESASLQDLNLEILMSQRVWGLTPRNLEQALALHLLKQQDLDLNLLVGPAGSGKTLLALAYGLHAILEEKRYNKLIVARSTPPIAEDIGFLPGTEEEKMAPWLAAFDDNLEVLHGNDESPYGSVDYVKERANIQFKSLNFMRGRSFSNAYIIIDEAQGLTQFQLKSIITRVGQNSKIVILGNLAQIDNKYITPLTSGLTYVVERFKHYSGAGLMHINGIERSELAAFAEENL